MKHRGFSLVELLIVVAVAGIVAAIAVPAVLRSRVAANESATIANLKTIVSAEAAYSSVNQRLYDGVLACLSGPSNCIPNYPPSGPTFLDSSLAGLFPRSGYYRAMHPGPSVAVPASASASSTAGYAYLATPMQQGQTGVRGFAVDASGKICWTPDGTMVPESAPGELDPNCRILD